jgi:hypothetical protein
MLIRRQLGHIILYVNGGGGGIPKSLDELRLRDGRIAREVLQLPPYDGQLGQGG